MRRANTSATRHAVSDHTGAAMPTLPELNPIPIASKSIIQFLSPIWREGPRLIERFSLL